MSPLNTFEKLCWSSDRGRVRDSSCAFIFSLETVLLVSPWCVVVVSPPRPRSATNCPGRLVWWGGSPHQHRPAGDQDCVPLHAPCCSWSQHTVHLGPPAAISACCLCSETELEETWNHAVSFPIHDHKLKWTLSSGRGRAIFPGVLSHSADYSIPPAVCSFAFHAHSQLLACFSFTEKTCGQPSWSSHHCIPYLPRCVASSGYVCTVPALVAGLPWTPAPPTCSGLLPHSPVSLASSGFLAQVGNFDFFNSHYTCFFFSHHGKK